MRLHFFLANAEMCLVVAFLSMAAISVVGCGSSEGGGGGSGEGGSSTGSAPAGAPCEEDADCEQGERCNAALDEPTCAAIRSVVEGDACSDSDLCDDDGECIEEACAAPGSLEEDASCRLTATNCGAHCIGINAVCAEGLTCLGGECGPRSGEGSPCDGSDDDADDPDGDCRDGLRCCGDFLCHADVCP